MPAGSKFRDFAGQFSRGWLYLLALVLLGAAAAPVIWAHPRIGRGEKAWLIVLGCLQTAAAVLVMVMFVIWLCSYCRRSLDTGQLWPY